MCICTSCQWVFATFSTIYRWGDKHRYVNILVGCNKPIISWNSSNITLAKVQPELIFLLDLQAYFPPVPSLVPQGAVRRSSRALPNVTTSEGMIHKHAQFWAVYLYGLIGASQSTGQSSTMDYNKLFDVPFNEPLTKDMATQTEAHPVPSHIDRNYHWNEWELRRRAIKLVELRHKHTHSTQVRIVPIALAD